MSTDDTGVMVHRSQIALALARLAGVVNGLHAIRDRQEKLSDVAFVLIEEAWNEGRARVVREDSWPALSRSWTVDDAILSLTVLHAYLEAFVYDDVAEIMKGTNPIALHVKRKTA